ncbi:hypothetical protein [Halococcus sp. AFM35]|uniref:hypothetical protein n=1 Tax=Halococcus sp. AFM35 TaxID=3421653 RepID=UPI003EBF7B62
MKRRGFLNIAATGGVVTAAGCSGKNENTRNATDTSPTSSSSGDSETTNPDFVWAEQPLWKDERVRENLFAFAARHDLAVVIAKADAEDPSLLEPPLAAAARHGVEAWLNIGVLTRLTPTEFVTDTAKGHRHLDGLEAVAENYQKFFPDGRIILWQEAPVGGRWVESGKWTDAAVRNLETLGPDIFAAQKERVKRAAPSVATGIFVHFPYIVEGRNPETFATLTRGLKSRNALPDFTFTDFYRGWYAKDTGPGPANAAVRSLVTNAREMTEGRPVTFLGEAHTINPNYTPSRQAMWMDLRAALGAGAEGVGWYARTAYEETKQGFDPFVPNVGPAARDGPRTSTLTFARDRYQYAYAALRTQRAGRASGGDSASEERFDLWLAGTDFDFYDHRLSMRTRAGKWRFIGDFNGYVNGGYPHNGNDIDHVSVFRGLSRARFDRGGRFNLRIETDPASDGAQLQAVLAMPADVDTYLPESAAIKLYGEQPHLHEFSSGHKRVDARLTAGESRRIGVALVEPKRPLDALVFPNHRAQRERLQALESRVEFEPRDIFDLWVLVDGNDTDRLDGLSIVGDAGRQSLDEASTAVSTANKGAVFYGIERTHLRRRDGSTTVEVNGGMGAVTGVYAMPYAGTVAFRPAAEAISLIEADPASARTFSIAFQE